MSTHLICPLMALLLAGCAVNDQYTATDNGKAIVLRSGSREILSYNYAVTPAPEGVSHLYDRGGYIHPVCTPSGAVITKIQPADHYHHYGIWNPWTRTEYNGRVYDLWNLGDSLGTVRAVEVRKTYSGAEFAGFDAALEHVAFAPEGETVIMDEEWQVRATETPDGFLWDFKSLLTPSSDITLKQYRYQGLCIRGTDEWTEDETTMMTSEGLERPDIDASRANWIYVNGNQTGILMMSNPTNHNSPQPLRIWKNGAVFVCWSPPKTGDWPLEAGKTYCLEYRILTYDGKMTVERATVLWEDYIK